ncbi:MAG: hypothetical protein ACOYZ6_07980 [Chloroflexota bacterium]
MAEQGKKQRTKAGMDLGKILLWSAVLVESPRWAGAMLAADVSTVPDALSAFLNVMNTISGVAMGIVVVVATAYLLDAVRKTKPTVAVRRKKKTIDRPNFRFWGLLFFAGGLLALTPFVLGPYIVSRMTGETIAEVLAISFWQYTWSVAVVVAPAFVVGGVAFAQPGLVKVSETEPKVSTPVSEDKPKVSKPKDEKPETFGKWKHWTKVPKEERAKIAGMTDVRQVMDTYGVSERTAYNWMRDAREELVTDLAVASDVTSQS